MENKIINIINNTDKFQLIDFQNEESIKNINENNINIQLNKGNNNIAYISELFQSSADILITFDEKIVNIYTKDNVKLNSLDFSFSNKLAQQLGGEINGKMQPQGNLHFTWDEIVLK